MSKYPAREQALAACRRDAAYLDFIVKRKGVLSFDPESDAGREIYALFDALAQAAHPRRDPVIRLQGVEMAVEAIILRRSITTQLMRMGKFSIDSTRKGVSRRSAFGAAISAWNTCSQQLERACKMMGIEGYAQIEAVVDNEDDLKSLLKKKAERVQDAEFTSVGAEGEPSTTGADPALPADPEPASPASATDEALWDDADALAATPDQPTALSAALRLGTAATPPVGPTPTQSSTPETQTATPPPGGPASDSPATPDD